MRFPGKVEQNKKRSILCKQTLVHKQFQQREQFVHSSSENWVGIVTANLIPTAQPNCLASHNISGKSHCTELPDCSYIWSRKSTEEATLRELAGTSGHH